MENVSAETGNNISILHEDDDIIVIDKPAGILVHQDSEDNKSQTVVDWFLERAPEAQEVGEPNKGRNGETLLRSGIVHRLDRDTSGVMVLAKNQTAFIYLKTQFKDRRAKKEYRAFVYGTMKEKWGKIDRPIGRSAKDFRKRSAERGARGTLRNAVTDWECIGQSDEYAYLKFFPRTGRTHQIRVHAKAIGRPIVGDSLYAPPQLLTKSNLGFNRLALHAYTLTLTFPDGGEKRFIAPLPSDFEAAETSIAT